MPVWFFAVVIFGSVWVFGPFTEDECSVLLAEYDGGAQAVYIRKGFLAIPPPPGGHYA